jgi:acetylornithine deacetylase/succinyl-diaminopimelate desuccinylase-like protein
VDWDALGRETVETLTRYLRVDTTNPPGNEIAGAQFLAEVLAASGVPSEIAESEPGRANLYARLGGDGSLPGIVLHHHIDVVYADRRYWTMDPFAGVIKDGFVYGRGTLDMKGLGIVQLVAFLALKRAGVRLARDLVYLATADEEAGSRHGARFVEHHRRHWLEGAGYALSETGTIEAGPGLRAPVGQIVISERTALPLRLTARGEPGHGSMPWPDTAPNRLVRALSRLLAAERPVRVLPDVQAFWRLYGSALAGDAGRGLDDLERSLRDPRFRARFLADRYAAATVRTTFALTMLKGSDKRNVIPAEAVADVDCRTLPGDEPEEIVSWVRSVIADDAVDVTIVGDAKAANVSAPDTDLYKALADGYRRRAPGAVVAPALSAAFTDNWVFRHCGLDAYGWTPFVLDAREWRGMHGNDERISLENLHGGVRAYTEMLVAVAAP